MNIYLITATVDVPWDGYDAWVIAAPTKEKAFAHCGWADTEVKGMQDVEFKIVGTAIEGLQEGEILGSFNAG